MSPDSPAFLVGDTTDNYQDYMTLTIETLRIVARAFDMPTQIWLLSMALDKYHHLFTILYRFHQNSYNSLPSSCIASKHAASRISMTCEMAHMVRGTEYLTGYLWIVIKCEEKMIPA